MNLENGLVDFHCHLDLYPNYQCVVKECETWGIFTLGVTTTPKAWKGNLMLTQNTRFVRSALGLHPQLINERFSEISLWEKFLPETRYVGEVGLDASPRFYNFFDKQREAFIHILKCCSLAGNKILSIHSLRATKIVLDLIEKYFSLSTGKIVLHWFLGNKTDMQRASSMGCYFSINLTMLEARQSTSFSLIPPDRLLTETDGPFTKIKNKLSHPADIKKTICTLAEIYKTTPNDVTLQIKGNLINLLKY